MVGSSCEISHFWPKNRLCSYFLICRLILMNYGSFNNLYSLHLRNDNVMKDHIGFGMVVGRVEMLKQPFSTSSAQNPQKSLSFWLAFYYFPSDFEWKMVYLIR